MSNVIYRSLGGYTHVLNVALGEIMTFDNLSEDELMDLETGDCENLDVEDDTRKLFSFRGQPNTRLCRSRLIDLGMEFSFPTIVNIELNRRCSLKCAHCYLDKSQLNSLNNSLFDRMAIIEIKQLLCDLKEMGVFCLAFTGGEPFLNRNIKNFVDIALALGFVIEFFSNLQELPDWLFHPKYKEANIGRFQTSVYSNDLETHDYITTIKGSWLKTLKNLIFLQTSDYYSEVATPLMLFNYNDWLTTQKYFRDQKITQNFAWPILSHYYNSRQKNFALNISPEQLKDFVSANPDFLIKVDLKNIDKPLCAMGKAIFCIAANGDVFPCSQLPISVGNITNKSIIDIFNSNQMQCFSSLKKKDVGIDRAYNFCVGQNYTETGYLFHQPQFVLDSFSALTQ